MHPPWHESQTGSLSLETERRLTRLEVRQEDRQETNEDRWERSDDRFTAIEKRLSLHEKAILGICGVLQVVLQDKYPKLAAIIRGLM
jgi:hypothetical protein